MRFANQGQQVHPRNEVISRRSGRYSVMYPFTPCGAMFSAAYSAHLYATSYRCWLRRASSSSPPCLRADQPVVLRSCPLVGLAFIRSHCVPILLMCLFSPCSGNFLLYCVRLDVDIYTDADNLFRLNLSQSLSTTTPYLQLGLNRNPYVLPFL